MLAKLSLPSLDFMYNEDMPETEHVESFSYEETNITTAEGSFDISWVNFIPPMPE